MDSRELERAESLFHGALDLDPAERRAFLERECGADARLRDEVLALIESDRRTSGFMAVPAVAVVASAIRASVRAAIDGLLARGLRVMVATGDSRFAAAAGRLGPNVVGHAPRRHLDEPADRTVGNALLGPLHRRGQQSLLDGVFGGGEVSVTPDHRPENPRRQLAQQVLGSGDGLGTEHAGF